MKEGGFRMKGQSPVCDPLKPLISIITVVYNAEKLIRPTIESVLNQTWPNIEFIVIDGDSADQTLRIALEFEERIAYWKSERDSGIYDAMNKGQTAAKGDYLLFLNAGDQLHHPKVLEELFASSPDADIYYGRTELIDTEGNIIGERQLKPPLHLHWKSFRMGMLVSHQAFIPKRALTEPFQTSYRISSDIDWCIRCMKKASSLVNTKIFISKYLIGGLSRQQTQKAWKERFAIMKAHYGLMQTLIFHVFIMFRFIGYFSKSRKLD